MAEKKVMKLASRGKRFGAFCIDFIVPFFVYLVFFGILSAAGINPYNQGFGYGFGYGYGYGYDLGYNYGSRLSGASAAIMIVLFLVLLAYIVVECIFFAKGKSVGKAIVGLQVVSSHDGKPFGFWKMMLRECIVKQASGVMLLGFIWVLIDDKNRAWHDKILDSYVVDLKESEKMNLRRKLEKADELYSAKEAAKTEASVQAAEPAKPEAQPFAAEPAEEESKPVVVEAIEPAEAAGEKPVVTPYVTVEEKPAAEPEEEGFTELEAAASETAETAAAAVPETAETAAEAAEDAETAADPQPDMSMKKAELLEAAEKAGVKVGSRATKEEIIEAIKNASEKREG